MDWMQYARWSRSLPACSDRRACSAVSTPTFKVNRPPPWWSRAVPSPPSGIIVISPDDPASLPRSGAHDWQDGGVTFRVFDCTSDDPEQRAIAVDEAGASVERGECIVLPTDTVYGIGADAFDSNAVQRLLDAKGRGRDMPPPVPDHALARAILRRTGPLAVSSANLSGRPAAVTCQQAVEQLGESVAIYIDGGPSGGAGSAPSTIVDFTRHECGEILRRGALSPDVLRGTLPDLLDSTFIAENESGPDPDEHSGSESPARQGHNGGDEA